MSPPKYHRLDPGQRREQILDAANALFAGRPYDEVSIEDIANAAGVSRGLVHHYFGGRKDVYIGLLERLGALPEQPLRPPVETLTGNGIRRRSVAGFEEADAFVAVRSVAMLDVGGERP